jgi:hypothetical protein
MAQAIAYARTLQKKRGILGKIKERLYSDIVKVLDADFMQPSVPIDTLMVAD